MKKIYLLLFLLSSLVINAQNYQCFEHNNAVYFYIDSINYLRVIRIDSIITSGTDTIFYPLRQLRYNCSGVSDTAGASWLGEKVIEHTDGTFAFGNAYNDSVIIKTQANLGNYWMFYSDSGTKYYIATITVIDTMTILGSIDSIKTVSESD